MKLQCLLVVLLSCLLACPLFAQSTGTGSKAAQPLAQPAAPPLDPELSNLLQQVDQLASTLNVELGRLRVERWKTDSATKRQAETNIDSIQRNLTAALPGLVAAVRNSPANLAPSFRLYRNLDALFDVLNAVAEPAGAFGSRDQFERLADKVNELNSLRTAYGKRVEAVAEAQALELAQLRRQAAGQGTVSKKVVDDNAPPAKSKNRKRAAPAQQPSAQP